MKSGKKIFTPKEIYSSSATNEGSTIHQEDAISFLSRHVLITIDAISLPKAGK